MQNGGLLIRAVQKVLPLPALAVSNWTDLRFSVIKRNIMGTEPFAGNPQIIVGADSKYYLFLHSLEPSCRAAEAADITGPYVKPEKILPVNNHILNK